MKNPSVDLQILEELSNLEYFIVKSPVNTPEFWKEWQEKFSRAYMGRIAVKKLIKSKKVSYEELGKYKAQLSVYEDILFYLETLKNIAMSLRGIFMSDPNTELDDEDAVSAEKTVVVDGRKYTIAGRIDAILDNVVGIEVKSNTSPPDEPLPLPWHVTQAKAYNWLFNLQKTWLVYVTPHGIYQFEVSEQITEEEVRWIIREEKSPRWSWECRHCEFAPLCHVPRLKKEKEGGNASSQ